MRTWSTSCSQTASSAATAKASGPASLGSLELIQAYSFDAPLNRGDGVNTSQLGPTRHGSAVDTNPGHRLRCSTVTTTASIKNLRSTSLAASLSARLGMLNLTWYESYNARDRRPPFVPDAEPVRVPQGRISARCLVQIAYDIVNAIDRRPALQVNYQGSCWNISAQYRDTTHRRLSDPRVPDRDRSQGRRRSARDQGQPWRVLTSPSSGSVTVPARTGHREVLPFAGAFALASRRRSELLAEGVGFEPTEA